MVDTRTAPRRASAKPAPAPVEARMLRMPNGDVVFGVVARDLDPLIGFPNPTVLGLSWCRGRILDGFRDSGPFGDPTLSTDIMIALGHSRMYDLTSRQRGDFDIGSLAHQIGLVAMPAPMRALLARLRLGDEAADGASGLRGLPDERLSGYHPMFDRAGLKVFRSWIPPGVLHFLSRNLAFPVFALRRMMASPDRVQALSSMPFLGEPLAGDRMLPAIDRRLPLTEVLARHTRPEGVTCFYEMTLSPRRFPDGETLPLPGMAAYSPGDLRRESLPVQIDDARLRRLSRIPARLGTAPRISTARLAAAVPPDWIPVDDPVRSIGMEICAGAVMRALPDEAGACDIFAAVKRWKGRWDEAAIEVADAVLGADREFGSNPYELLARAGHVRHVRQWLVQQVIAPIAVIGGATEQQAIAFAEAQAFPRTDIASLLRLSARWHAEPGRRIVGADGRSTALAPDVRWPVPLPVLKAREGLSLIPLTTQGELMDEGARVPDAHGVLGNGHCIGTFGKTLLSGDGVVLSVRDGNGRGARRLSTAYITIGRGPKVAARLVEHRARGNTQPEERAEAAVARLVAAIESGNVTIDPAWLAWRPPERAGTVADIVAIDPDIAVRQLELVQPFLDPKLKRRTIEEIAAMAANHAPPAVPGV